MGFTDDCEAILALMLEHGPRSRDQIKTTLGMDYRKVESTLTELRLAGRIGSDPPKRINGVKTVLFNVKVPTR